MNNRNRLVKTGIAAALALLMAGASAQAAVAALGLTGGALPAWLAAATTAALCAMAAWSGPMAIVAGALGAAGGGIALAANVPSIAALQAWIASFGSGEALDGAALALAGGLLAAVLAVLLCALLYVLLSRPAGTPFALLIYFALLVGCYASAELPLGMAVPGLAAALTALALSGEVPRDGGAWRALIPVALALALALVLTPSERLTWEPLERVGQTIRAAFEDYFRFTEERVPFTISTEGYNHAAEVDGAVVARLGGPANPDPDPVMRVTADGDVLLRGAIRRTYTGSTWVDSDAKARYLYYDFTRRSIRERVFGMTGNDALAPVNVTVEILNEGTSSLFVPGRLGEFEMGLDTAVYFNSIGEMFLSRQVEAGDGYALSGWRPSDMDALRAAVIAAAGDSDGDYAEMLSTCTALPDCIEEGVYALTIGLTRDQTNAFDKAAAIQSWLRQNCAYTLTPDYPQQGRDFVSEFVLDTREGYCSYFASAMTVMCRIAGLPARYVEGYSIRNTNGESAVITGEDAHAWTEVYFNGIGWVAFDPSNGSGGGIDDGDTASDADAQEDPGSGDPEATPEPTPTIPPDSNAQSGDFPYDEPTPSPTPEADDGFAGDPGAVTPPPADAPVPDTPDANGSRSHAWLWILLIVLLLIALIALAVLWIRRRLADADPIRLSAQAKTARQAMMILYRSILTLLAQTGQVPMSGETPGAFARRVGAQTRNPDFIAFADAVAMSVYARAGASRENVEQGRRAYRAFLSGLRRGERLRFAVTRIFKGLGDFESIP